MTKWKGVAASYAPMVGAVAAIAIVGALGASPASAACTDTPTNARATGGDSCTAAGSNYTNGGNGTSYTTGLQPVFATQASTLTLNAPMVTVVATAPATDPATQGSLAVNAYLDSTVHFLGGVDVAVGGNSNSRGFYAENGPGSALASITVDGNASIHRDIDGAYSAQGIDSTNRSFVSIGGDVSVIGYLSKGLNARGAGTIVIGGNTEVLLTSTSPYSAIEGAINSKINGVGDAVLDYSLVHIQGNLRVETALGSGLYARGNLNNTIVVNGDLRVTTAGTNSHGLYALDGGKIFIDPAADATFGSADDDTRIVMRRGVIDVSGLGSAGLRAEITNTASAGDVDVEMTGGTINASGYGVYANNQGTGTVLVTTNGPVTATGTNVVVPATLPYPANQIQIEAGIYALAGVNTTGLTIQANGPVNGGAAGVFAVNEGAGPVNITAVGLVTASAGMGVGVINEGEGDTNVTSGAVTALAPYPSTVGAPAYGISVQNTSTAGNLTVTTNGDVTATANAIRALNQSSTANLSIATNANVTSTMGTGIDAGLESYVAGSGAAATGTLTVTANGNVSGATNGIIANGATTGDVSVTANGVVTASNQQSVGIGASGLGNVSVEAKDAVTAGLFGIQVQTGAGIIPGAVGSVTVVAEKNVTASGPSTLSQGIPTSGIFAFVSDLSPISVTTSGTVTGTDAGISTITFAPGSAGSAAINVNAGSVVQGGNTGLFLYSSVAQTVAVGNAGTIKNLSGASNALAISASEISADGQSLPPNQAAVTVNNTGLVLGTVKLADTANLVDNKSDGVWNTAGGENWFSGGKVDGGNGEVKNSGQIISATPGAGAAVTTTFNGLKSFGNNAGGVLAMQSGVAGDRTVINGNYVGSGGMVTLDTVLGNDNSITDRLAINGNSTGASTLKVKNAGGAGAQTVEGIKVIDVTGGDSSGKFNLDGDFVFQGQQAVVAGAYAYRLYQGGTSTPDDGDWYLRSNTFNPVVPVAEVYPQHLLGLNGLPTLQQRVGNRYWNGEGANVVAEGADAIVAENPAPEGANPTYTEGSAFWARIEGAHASIDPAVSTSNASYEQNVFRLQSGLDFQLMENEAGKLIGGITLHYVHGKSDIASPSGNGDISTDGYGVGGTLTWYGNNGFYVDGQGQATWYDSNLSSATAGRSLVDGNDAFGYALSLETGKRVDLNNGLTLTPQAQLVYSNVDFDSFVDPWGVGVSLGNGDSLRGRLGVSLDKETSWTAANGTLSRNHLYGVANLHYEFLQGTEVDVAGVSFENRPERLWGEIGAGVSYNWNDDKFSLYGEGSVSTSLSSFGDSYALKGTAGFRVKW